MDNPNGLLFAIFNGGEEITDVIFSEVKNFADYINKRNNLENKKTIDSQK